VLKVQVDTNKFSVVPKILENLCSPPSKDKTLLFYEAFRAVMGTIKLPIQWVLGFFPSRKSCGSSEKIQLHFYTYECVEIHVF